MPLAWPWTCPGTCLLNDVTSQRCSQALLCGKSAGPFGVSRRVLWLLSLLPLLLSSPRASENPRSAPAPPPHNDLSTSRTLFETRRFSESPKIHPKYESRVQIHEKNLNIWLQIVPQSTFARYLRHHDFEAQSRRQIRNTGILGNVSASI